MEVGFSLENGEETPQVRLVMFGEEVDYNEVVTSSNPWNDICKRAKAIGKNLGYKNAAAFGVLKDGGDTVVLHPSDAVDVTRFSVIKFEKIDGAAAQ